MCRYAFKQYKSHYACFDCRKCFKYPDMWTYFANTPYGIPFFNMRRVSGDPAALLRLEQQYAVTLAELEQRYQALTRTCPECKKPLADLGRDFKAPRKSNLKAWRTLRDLYRVGFVFHTCGCSGPGFIPVSPIDFRAYLLARKHEYEQQLTTAQNDPKLTANTRLLAAKDWQEKLLRIETELERTSVQGV